MSKYFKDIYSGVTTVLLGMWVTFRHLFDRAITVQYPRETLPMNKNTRARLVNHIDECGYCLACARVCPVNIFTIKGVRADKDEDLGMLPDGKPKRVHVIQFDIDMSKCVYCGLCVDACDTKSLRWEAPQEECSFTRPEMHKSFANIPPDEVQNLLAKEEERKKQKAAEAAAKKKTE